MEEGSASSSRDHEREVKEAVGVEQIEHPAWVAQNGDCESARETGAGRLLFD